MPTTTPIQALPIPILSDVANVPLHVQNLAQALEKQLVMVFASAASRTTAIPSPVDGMLSYRTDAKIYESYNVTAAAWVRLGTPGQQIQHGTFSYTIAAGVGTATVTFPVAFAGVPDVTLDFTPITTNTPVTWGCNTVTAANFTWYAKTVSGSGAATLSARYIAVFG